MSIAVRAYTEQRIAGCGLFLFIDDKGGMHGGGIFCQDFAGNDCRLVLEPGAFGEPWSILRVVNAPSQSADAFPKAIATTVRIGALTIDPNPVVQSPEVNGQPVGSAVVEPAAPGTLIVRLSVDRYALGFDAGVTVSPPIPARFDVELTFVRLA